MNDTTKTLIEWRIKELDKQILQLEEDTTMSLRIWTNNVDKLSRKSTERDELNETLGAD